MNKKAVLCSALLLASPSALSDELLHWWDFSVSALYGQDYEVDPHDQTTITFETAGAWKYGDWFAFQDVTFFNGNNNGMDDTTYGEITTRFSMGKIFGMPSMGPISDLSLALSLEEGKGDVESLLYGIGMDIQIPGFTYFQLNTFRRQSLHDEVHKDGWQISPAFRIDIPIGNSNIVFDGYIDWVISYDDDGAKENLHINPQLKYDLGQAIMGKDKANKLFVGVEYDYWANKYGIADNEFFEVNQNTFSFLVKYHF
ncbi:ion channel protein Tsx [Shewanella sp. NFH-SH190041]|uniref:outer membrane protein OmpK n=1 Tax=Shewanella sp. NFH-SH190041 TaxID=2950245 RepID=UPI0021C362C5|nr:outer membrane protein OmpK [Shewanella sp. NFH-SH190041]BDM62950.1 ion channel protein Tsx [Shewanella sp. NFH-SH190041]